MPTLQPPAHQYRIIDSCSVLSHVTFHPSIEYITVKGVAREVELNDQISIKEPSESSMAFIKKTAIKTGDIHTLSEVDMEVLALMCDYWKEHVGPLKDVASLPDAQTYSIKQSLTPLEKTTQVDQDGFTIVASKKKKNMQTKGFKDVNLPGWTCEDEGGWITPSVTQTTNKSQVAQEDKTVAQEDQTESSLVESDSVDASTSEMKDDLDAENILEDDQDLSDNQETSDTESLAQALESTHLNKVDVACMTSDFAMQNILLHLNMKLISPTGKRITRLKSWVLRCHACYKITRDLNRRFCGYCGNHTLMRTSVGIDKNGHMTCYLKKNFQYNNRGTKYSVPMPKGGRHNKDIILSEDSIPKRRMKKVVNQPLDAGELFERDVKSGKRMDGVIIGYGRKNPNERPRKKV